MTIIPSASAPLVVIPKIVSPSNKFCRFKSAIKAENNTANAAILTEPFTPSKIPIATPKIAEWASASPKKAIFFQTIKLPSGPVAKATATPASKALIIKSSSIYAPRQRHGYDRAYADKSQIGYQLPCAQIMKDIQGDDLYPQDDLRNIYVYLDK